MTEATDDGPGKVFRAMNRGLGNPVVLDVLAHEFVWSEPG